MVAVVALCNHFAWVLTQILLFLFLFLYSVAANWTSKILQPPVIVCCAKHILWKSFIQVVVRTAGMINSSMLLGATIKRSKPRGTHTYVKKDCTKFKCRFLRECTPLKINHKKKRGGKATDKDYFAQFQPGRWRSTVQGSTARRCKEEPTRGRDKQHTYIKL